jgi:hypothetical protein
VIKDHNNARVKEFLAKGIFVDMKIWKPLATRQFYTLQHLTLYADDYRSVAARPPMQLMAPSGEGRHALTASSLCVQMRGVGQARLQDGDGYHGVQGVSGQDEARRREPAPVRSLPRRQVLLGGVSTPGLARAQARLHTNRLALCEAAATHHQTHTRLVSKWNRQCCSVQ